MLGLIMGAAVVFAGCSNEEKVIPISRNTKAQLGVNVTVGATSAARISRAEGLRNASLKLNDSIGVILVGTGYPTPPELAGFVFEDLDGTSDGVADTWTPKVPANLNSDNATVYAFYPKTGATFNGGGALTNDALNVLDCTIPAVATVFDGSEHDDYMFASASATASSGSGTLADPYLYAEWPFASNAVADEIGSSIYDNKVDLFFHHALAKLTFVINKGTSYSGAGDVTNFKLLKNTSTTSFLTGSFSMNLATGELDTSGSTGVETLEFAVATAVPANASPTATDSTVVGLVIPIDGLDGFRLRVTIDGKEMEADLPTDVVTEWAPGNNYRYTVVVSGTALEATTVSVVDWVDTTAGEIPVQ